MKITSLISIVSISIASTGLAQDPLSSQPASGNVNYNTALAGCDTKGRLTLNYRNQWANLSGNYITTNINFYQYIPKTNGYGGIHLMNDQQGGVIQTNSAFLFYSQNFHLKDVLFRPSLEVGYNSKSIDWGQLTFGDQIDPQQGFTNSTTNEFNKKTNYVNIGAGIMVYYKKILLGFSAKNMNQPNESLLVGGNSPLPTRYGIQASYQFSLGKFDITPFGMYFNQNSFQSTTFGLDFLWLKHFNFAVSYHAKDNVNFMIGYHHKYFAVNYSYGYTISRLNNGVSGGTHEIGIIGKFWKLEPKKKFTEISSVFSR